MSEATQDTVKCPNCDTESTALIYESINSILNYEQVERMFDGTLFAHECPNCHSTIELTYPCLYNDMEHHVMVQYIIDEKKLDEAIGLIDKMAREENAGHEEDLEVTTRIVTSHNQLREKALIFKEGLSDMAIEALKAVMMNRFIDEGQITGDAECFFGGMTEVGDIVLAFVVDGRTAETVVPRSLYDRVFNMVAGSRMAREKTYVVDPGWAALFFQRNA